jgi:phosphoenolpyruvate phosphomutase
MKKTTQLKSLINSPEITFLMEAHNGLSAKIVEEAGFKGIWGSGLSISASLGVRDNNEASWTQVLDVLEFMSDATSIPILLTATQAEISITCEGWSENWNKRYRWSLY